MHPMHWSCPSLSWLPSVGGESPNHYIPPVRRVIRSLETCWIFQEMSHSRRSLLRWLTNTVCIGCTTPTTDELDRLLAGTDILGLNVFGMNIIVLSSEV